MKSIRILSAVAVVSSIFLAGCAADGSYNAGYQRPAYQTYQTPAPTPNYGGGYYQGVRYGVVYNVRQVPLQGGPSGATSGAGIGIGAVAGGILGNQIGHGRGRTAATVLGAVGGGFLGNEVEKRNYSPSTTVPGIELQVKLDGTGEMVTVVQPDQGQNFRGGARVRVSQENGQWVASY